MDVKKESSGLEIVCHLHPSQDLHYASRIYSGLCELQQGGVANVSFVRTALSQGYYTVLMRVKSREGRKPLLVAIELLDQSNTFDTAVLAACDVYLKRSYYKPDQTSLSDDLRAKIKPFGLTYPCRTVASIRKVLPTLLPAWGPGLRHMLERGPVLWQFLSGPNPRSFERDPRENAVRSILFQTRVWAPEDISEDAHEINEERVAIVRALRKAFGEQFQGGLVPTLYAKQNYSDDISNHSPRHSQYAKWGRKSLIGINSRGLHHSLPFKLGEYLAGSKCIVTCPLRNELPSPLITGQHCLVFRTPEQCVDLCADLLRNSELAGRLRNKAWEYYQREVEPGAHLLKSLSQIQWNGNN